MSTDDDGRGGAPPGLDDSGGGGAPPGPDDDTRGWPRGEQDSPGQERWSTPTSAAGWGPSPASNADAEPSADPRPGWTSRDWGTPARSGSTGWSQATGPAYPRDAPSGQRTGRVTALVLGTSIVAALAASLGTAALVVPAAQPARTAPPGSATPASHSVVQVIDGSQAIVDVAARVSPAVVTITNSAVSTGFGPFSVPQTGVGSGFIFRADGFILTNWHVVDGADQLTVALNDGRQLTGRVLASDQSNDLAVVKVDGSGLPVASLGSSADLKTGQLVVAIGSPLGTFTDSVTSGILSATGRSLSVSGNGRGAEQLSNLLQTDAAINEGNSGGPLLDASGQVVGINVAVATSAQGIGFAVPVDAARNVIGQAGA